MIESTIIDYHAPFDLAWVSAASSSRETWREEEAAEIQATFDQGLISKYLGNF